MNDDTSNDDDDEGCGCTDKQAFGGFLTHNLIHAVQDHGMAWQDAVFCTGMALRAFGELVAIMERDEDGKPRYTPDQVACLIADSLASTRLAEVQLVRLDSAEELDAYATGAKQGFH